MSAAELKAALSLSLVFFLRMLPLFMLLPVLALAAESYQGSTPQLLGLALGVYGLTQASLQIPFGMLSDRWGRKPIIILGLIIFMLGSLLAASSDSIYGLILGRALQGAGAVAAAIMALAADLTSEQHRTKAMALIGVSIGAAFSIAFVIGPLLFPYIGINGLFYLGIGLAALAIVTLVIFVPNPVDQQISTTNSKQNLRTVIFDKYLMKLNFSIFTSHMILMANFVVIPIALRDFAQLSPASHWQVYLSVIFASLFIMVPFIIFGDRLNKTKTFYISSIMLILASQLGLAFLHIDLSSIIIFLIIFFGAFNYLEALLPSEVSKASQPDTKGTAMGLYSSSQFIGIFIGGLAGGFFHQAYGITSVHLFCLLATLLWFVIVVFLPQNETI
jgi:predicted MFS family arabinose efflux permease